MATIRCSKCQKAMDTPLCLCGNTHCMIRIYWKGKPYKIWHGSDGFPLDYGRADALRGTIRTAIAGKTFNVLDFLAGKVRERKFEHKVDLWLTHKEHEMEIGSKRPSSISNIRGYIKNYYLPYFEGYDVRDIGFEELEAFKDQLPGKISLKTQSNIIIQLRSFFTWLWKKGVIKMVPPWPVITGITEVARQAITRDCQDIELEKIPQPYRDLLQFGMETAIRPGELVCLKVKDVMLEDRELFVGRTISAYSHEIESTKGKHHKYIPLSDIALAIAKRHVRDKLKDAYLFVNPVTGKRYSVKAPNRLWKKFTGSTIVYYASSRHSLATQLIRDGVPLPIVQQLLRQADIRTTMKYVHVGTEDVRNALNQRGKIVPLTYRDNVESVDAQ